MGNTTLDIVKTKDFAVTSLNDEAWKTAKPVTTATYWSGEKAPGGRTFEARMLWSDTAIYVRFEANQTEPLVVSKNANVSKKMHGLWERDVCEIFIAPNRSTPNKYFEFEIAPNGEWLDVGLEVIPMGRKSSWDYKSGMETAARVDNGKVVMAIKIPFSSLGKTPKPGDVWLGNLFRCVGKDPTRGYLAWRPTKTDKPSFHVPKAFGEFRFVE
jgi:hypothetical protein